jgi:hypothetical protein
MNLFFHEYKVFSPGGLLRKHVRYADLVQEFGSPYSVSNNGQIFVFRKQAGGSGDKKTNEPEKMQKDLGDDSSKQPLKKTLILTVFELTQDRGFVKWKEFDVRQQITDHVAALNGKSKWARQG